jgi:23S rRNA (uracil1939-C5)-methyltransferase
MRDQFTVTIEKLDPYLVPRYGQGLAHLGDVKNPRLNNKPVFVWNALPGEEVVIEIIKNKKTYLDATAVQILKPSPERISPREGSFLSTSAWQILSPERENYWKRAIAAETYSKIGDMIISPDGLDIGYDGVDWGYRNKVEFTFCSPYFFERNALTIEERKTMRPAPADDPISLAFFERGGRSRFAVDRSALSADSLNDTAEHILSWINSIHIPIRSLKSLIVRTNTAGQTIGALFLKDKLNCASYPELTDSFVGFQLYYSTHKSPTSVPTALLYSVGQDYLVQDILGTQMKFGALSFFQINPPVFELAVKDIAMFLDAKKPVVDFYAGVGAISLPLAMNRTETLLVESNDEAVAYATENIARNNINHAQATCEMTEDMLGEITRERQIILDPPRAGLHETVIKRLLEVRPERIIYLSCNISTQARDMKMLSEVYRPIFMKLYNFFPRTPHIEGLVVLERM